MTKKELLEDMDRDLGRRDANVGIGLDAFIDAAHALNGFFTENGVTSDRFDEEIDQLKTMQRSFDIIGGRIIGFVSAEIEIHEKEMK